MTVLTPKHLALVPESRLRLEKLVAGGGPFDIEEAAFLVGAEDDHGADVRTACGLLDEMGDVCRGELPTDASPMEEMGALTRVVFQAFGFGGDRSDYYDPANSHLHRVLERRKGIPISLALVLLGVARRVGVPLHGINFPCHFLVGHRDRADYFIDPFNEGTILGIPQCEALLKRVAGGRVSFHADLLKPVSNRRILLRMLGNLKGIYLRSQDLPQAVAVTERILLMEPTNWGEVRDRGLLYLKMGAYQRAVEDLDTYLSKADHVPDRAIIGRHLEQARVQAERLT